MLQLTRRELLRTAFVAGGCALSGGASLAWAKPTHPPAGVPRVDPKEIRIDPRRLQIAYDLMESWTSGRKAPVPGGAIMVGRAGRCLAPRLFGRQGPETDAKPIRRDAMFYMASVTKPVIYMAAMLLVERGQLNLSDRVQRYVPEFAGKGKEAVEVLHLFTHTSGLPDELPNNAELRRKQALEMNDEVVQGLSVAKYAFEVEDPSMAQRAVEKTLEAARQMVSELLSEGTKRRILGPGDLIRERPARVAAKPPEGT